MMLRAVIFDCDGTLLNSFELYYAAHVYAAQQHGGASASREVFDASLRKGSTLLQIFKETYPDRDHAAMLVANGEYLVEHLTDGVPFASLKPLLQGIQGMGLKLGLLTGGDHKVQTLLKHHDIADHFSSVVHFERTSKPKPDAEGFLLATKECGVQPGEAIMVGDTVTDIRTGRNAHALATIGITHGISTRAELEEANADYIVDSLPALLALIKQLHITT